MMWTSERIRSELIDSVADVATAIEEKLEGDGRPGPPAAETTGGHP
jgi:hypothetical protein